MPSSITLGFCILALVFLSLVPMVLYQKEKTKRKKIEDAFFAQADYVERLENRVKLLESEAHIKEENRRKADEKISSLHIGDTLCNALDELQKPVQGKGK